MFITLLTVTFIIAFLVSFMVVRIFRSPINSILKRIIEDEISKAWSKYLTFAIFVTGISSGVNIRKIERYINPEQTGQDLETAKAIALNSQRWILEVYRTIIETLQGIAWMLLVFFIFALLAYVFVKIFGKKDKTNN